MQSQRKSTTPGFVQREYAAVLDPKMDETLLNPHFAENWPTIRLHARSSEFQNSIGGTLKESMSGFVIGTNYWHPITSGIFDPLLTTRKYQFLHFCGRICALP